MLHWLFDFLWILVNRLLRNTGVVGSCRGEVCAPNHGGSDLDFVSFSLVLEFLLTVIPPLAYKGSEEANGNAIGPRTAPPRPPQGKLYSEPCGARGLSCRGSSTSKSSTAGSFCHDCSCSGSYYRKRCSGWKLVWVFQCRSCSPGLLQTSVGSSGSSSPFL